MKLWKWKSRPVATEKLLRLRELAGEDPLRHERYHKTVNRYQRLVLQHYVTRKNFRFLKWWFHRKG